MAITSKAVSQSQHVAGNCSIEMALDVIREAFTAQPNFDGFDRRGPIPRRNRRVDGGTRALTAHDIRARLEPMQE